MGKRNRGRQCAFPAGRQETAFGVSAAHITWAAEQKLLNRVVPPFPWGVPAQGYRIPAKSTFKEKSAGPTKHTYASTLGTREDSTNLILSQLNA